MKIIKFRIIQLPTNILLVQTKTWFGWKYKSNIIGMDMIHYPAKYNTEQECIDRVLNDTKYKKSKIRVIQYPTLKIL